MYLFWDLQKQKVNPLLNKIHTSRNCFYVWFEVLYNTHSLKGLLANDIRLELKKDFPNLKVYKCNCPNGS